MIVKHNEDIKRISVNENGDIVLIGEGGAYTITVDWVNIQFNDDGEDINIFDEKKDENVIDYFRSEKYVMHYTRLRNWQKPKERVMMNH